MNKDIPVLEFEIDSYMKVLNNDFLPYELKDYVKDTSPDNLKKALADFDVLKDYFASRTLSLSRDNAKVILNVATLPQSLRTRDKLEIVFACKGLTMTDSFWIKEQGENVKYSDVNLRRTKLAEASYQIAILGQYISATAVELRPDLSTNGMFPKFWKRNHDSVELWKTDKFSEHYHTYNEVIVSESLKKLGLECVEYVIKFKDEIPFAVSKCIADEEYSLISAQSIKDWCIHTEKDFKDYIGENFRTEFANMCVVDYIYANPDRHFENWGFIVGNADNKIVRFAPLYDHNQALIADMFGTKIDELIYEPTGKSFYETILEYAMYSDLQIYKEFIPEQCHKRADEVATIRDEYTAALEERRMLNRGRK